MNDDRFDDEDEHRPSGGVCYGCGNEIEPGDGWLIEGHTLCGECADAYYEEGSVE